MLLPRMAVTQSLQPTPLPTSTPPSSAINRTSYNILTIVIAIIAAVVVLACFYLLHWRKRPESRHKVQLCVSRAGVARLRVGSPDRWRIVERVQREQEARGRPEADWGVRRKEEGARDGVTLPKYSRTVTAGDCRMSEPEIIGIQNQAIISVPPPAYDQTVSRSPLESRSHL